MTKFESENLKVAFKTAKSVLDEFGFPNLYTMRGKDVKEWIKDTLSQFENAWASESDDSLVLESNEVMIRVNYGATKLVIMTSEADDWVFKIPLHDYKSNYCQLEVEIYEMAQKENVSEFFAPCYFLENYDGVEIYVMAQADVSCGRLYSDLYERLSNEGRTDEEATEILEEVEDCSEYVEWLFPYYTDCEKFEALSNFLEDAGVNDLHSGNIGYINNRVVFIDYSGFYR
jgi:hypothetical protein